MVSRQTFFKKINEYIISKQNWRQKCSPFEMHYKNCSPSAIKFCNWFLKILFPFRPMIHGTGKLSREAFAKINIKKILWYMDFLKEKSPRHRPRYSQQAWLRQDKNADPILRRLLERWDMPAGNHGNIEGGACIKIGFIHSNGMSQDYFQNLENNSLDNCLIVKSRNLPW